MAAEGVDCGDGREIYTLTLSFFGADVPLFRFPAYSKYLEGRGAFGAVYKRYCKDLKCWVAVKEIEVELSKSTGAIAEAQTLFRIKHENIVRILGLEEVSLRKSTYNIVMEYMSHGSLKGFLLEHTEKIPWSLCWRFLLDIASGLNYLHNLRPKALIHGDVKADNILLDFTLRAKISDFGLSIWRTFNSVIAMQISQSGASEQKHEGRCTTTHCAPELLANINITRTPSLDVFSFGIFTWEVITKKPPFTYVHEDQVVAIGIRDGQRPADNDIPNTTEAISKYHLPVVVKLMKECWAQEPERRPKTEGVIRTLTEVWENINRNIDVQREIDTFITNTNIKPRNLTLRKVVETDSGSFNANAAWGHDAMLVDSDDDDSVIFMPKETWDPKSPRGDRDSITEPFKYVIICHTVSRMYRTTDECKQIMAEMQMYHFQRGFSDIAYNFVIGGDGNIYEGRGFDIQGSHTWRWNKKGLGVAFIGQFNNGFDKPIPKMFKALNTLLDLGVKEGKIERDYVLLGQVQVRGFDSPGKHVFEEMMKMEHWKTGYWSPLDDSGPEDPRIPPNALL